MTECSKTILIIDNDKSFTSLIAKLFKRERGYKVKVVPDGYNGIITARKLKPAIVLLDIRMPATSGLAVLEELKSTAETCSIPVIIITGFDDDENRNKALALKAACYLVKPFEFDLLQEKIAAALNGDRSHELYAPLPRRDKKKESKSVKVLLVEDDPSAAAMYQTIFRSAENRSFEVKWADSLVKALNHEKNRAFDMILLDLELPGSSGLNAFAKVKAKARGTPIIIMTCIENKELAAYAIREGAQDYIAKEKLERNMFLRVITCAIERSHMRKDLLGRPIY